MNELFLQGKLKEHHEMAQEALEHHLFKLEEWVEKEKSMIGFVLSSAYGLVKSEHEAIRYGRWLRLFDQNPSLPQSVIRLIRQEVDQIADDLMMGRFQDTGSPMTIAVSQIKAEVDREIVVHMRRLLREQERLHSD